MYALRYSTYMHTHAPPPHPHPHTCTGDSYRRHDDFAFADFQNLRKEVDDVLLCDNFFPGRVQHAWDLLCWCGEQGITLNPKKFQFAVIDVEYVCYKYYCASFGCYCRCLQGASNSSPLKCCLHKAMSQLTVF